MKLNTPIVGEAQLTEALIRAGKEVEALRAKMDQLQAREQKGRQYLVDICGIGSEDPMDFLCAAHAYQRAELDSLRAQLAETEAERDRQYEENVSQIMRYAALENQLAEREELIQDLAMSLTEAEPFIGYAMHVPLLKADVARALARFHAAEGEG